MDDFETSDMDQSIATVADYCAMLWSRMYKNLVNEGFSETDALLILRTYIMSQGNNK